MKDNADGSAKKDSFSSFAPDIANKIQQLRGWIDSAGPGDIVFFGGAGVSTESGIPDFRSPDGLYSQKTKYPYPPEVMISRTFFDAHTAEFYEFYCDRMLPGPAKPNAAHKKLVELEREGRLRAVVTQNIDGLHQAAGSRNVFELHGSVLRNYCMRCGAAYSLEDLLAARAVSEDGVPRCSRKAGGKLCGGIIKPDVVLYEEPLDSNVMEGAIQAIRAVDLMIIAGTSLVVYPAAGLLHYFQGSHLAIINRDPTPQDSSADLCIAANVGAVLDF